MENRRTRFGSFMVAALAALIVAGALRPAIAQDERGKRVGTISRLLIDQISKATGLKFDVGRVDGSVLGALTLRDVRVSDARGAVATVRLIRIDWSPTALFDGNIVVRELYVSDVRLIRAPPKAPKDAAPLDLSFLRLNFAAPLDVRIDKILFERIGYDRAVFGKEGQFTLRGRARIPRDQSSVDIALNLERTAGAAPEGRVIVKLDARSKQLAVDVSLEEAPGGVLGAQMGLRRENRVRLTVSGSAPVNAWRGRLDFAAGDDHGARLDIRTDTDGGRTRARVDGEVRSAALASSAPMLGARVFLSLDAFWGDRIEVTRLHLVGADAELLASGWYEPASNRADMLVVAQVDQLSQLGAMLGAPIAGRGTVDARVSGTIAAPRVEATVAADSFRIDRLSARSAILTLDARMLSADRQSGGTLALTLDTEDARLQAPDGTSQPLKDLRLTLDGTQSREAGKLGRFTLRAAFDEARFLADLTIDTLSPVKAAGTVDFTGSLPPAILYGGALEGARLSLRFVADQAARTGEAALTLTAGKIATGVPALDAILRGRANAGFAGRWAGDRIEVDRLDLATGRMSLTGSGRVSPDPADKLTLSLRIDDLADASGVVGQKLAGAVRLDATLWRAPEGLAAKSMLNATGLRVGRLTFGTVDASLAGQSLDRAPDLKFDLGMKGGILSGTVKGRVRSEAEAWRIDGLRARLNAGSLDADLRLRKAGGLIDGNVTARIRALAPLLRLAGQAGRGAATVRARLRSVGGRQTAAIVLRARGLALGAGKEAPTIGLLNADLRFADLAANPYAVSGGIVAGKMSLGMASVDRLGLRLVQRGAGTLFRLSARGVADLRRVTLSASGLAAKAGTGARIRLDRLDAGFGREKIALASPTTLALMPGGAMRLSETALKIAGGTVRIGLFRRGAYTDMTARAENVPARLLSYARIGRIDAGTLNGTLRLRGAGAPVVDFDIAAAGLRRRGAPADAALTLAAKGRYTRALLQLQASLKAAGAAEPLTMDVRLPRRGAVDATIKGKIDLAALSRSGLLVNQQVSGLLVADLRLSGTEAAPEARGTLRLENGRVVNAQTGLLLEKIDFVAAGQGDRLIIRNATATDGKQGTLKITGSARLGRQIGYIYALRVDASRFRVINREGADVTVDAGLDISSTQAAGISVAGKITVRGARIGLAATLPQSLTVVDVIEKNTPLELRRDARRHAASLPPPPIRLDVTVDVPGRFFVTGRGVYAELRGVLKVTGTAAAPLVRGALTTVAGYVDLLGKRFEFRRGEVRFATSDLSDPLLDFQAEADAGDIKGIVTIKGSAKKPKIDISSEPVLPRDEVLSRILFGKDVSKLTGVEALRLASGAATLFGEGAGDMTERIRRATGLDVIDVASDGKSTRAVFGKYVSERVLVKVEQGLQLDDTAAGVEVKIFRNFSGEAVIKSDGSARTGFKWSLDY